MVSFQSVSQDPPYKLWSEPSKWRHRVMGLFQRPPHLDGGVQRGLVKLLELRSDVQQVNLRPTHHDSGQSRLVSSAALKTSRARFNFTLKRWSPKNLHIHLHALIQELCKEGGDTVHAFHWRKGSTGKITHFYSVSFVCTFLTCLVCSDSPMASSSRSSSPDISLSMLCCRVFPLMLVYSTRAAHKERTLVRVDPHQQQFVHHDLLCLSWATLLLQRMSMNFLSSVPHFFSPAL